MTASTVDCKMLDLRLTKVESFPGIRDNSECWLNFVAGSAWYLVYQEFRL